MLAQLTYVSDRNSNCTDEEIKKILSVAEKYNPLLKITGVLLYTDTKFIQMLEGDAKLISGLYTKIKLDKRHCNFWMISFGPIDKKSFPSWHMGARKIEGSLVDFKSDISKEDEIIFNNMLNGKEESGAKVLNLLKMFF